MDTTRGQFAGTCCVCEWGWNVVCRAWQPFRQRGLPPGSRPQARTNPGRAETGSVCTAVRLSPLLPLPGQTGVGRASLSLVPV